MAISRRYCFLILLFTSFISFGQFNMMTSPLAGRLDNNASLFLRANGDTSRIDQRSVSILCIDFKRDTLWDSTYILFPLVGGTSTTAKYNLKDTTIVCTFVGSPTINSNGITTNGSSSYINTGVSPNTSSRLNSGHLSTYLKTANTALAINGSNDASANQSYFILSCYNSGVNGGIGNNYINQDPNAVGTLPSITVSSQQGFTLMSRTASNSYYAQRNSTQSNSTIPSVAINSFSTFFGCRNSVGTASNFYANTIQFIGQGKAISATRGLLYNTDVANFQTNLGR